MIEVIDYLWYPIVLPFSIMLWGGIVVTFLGFLSALGR